MSDAPEQTASAAPGGTGAQADRASRKSVELRLALVCYGGVSLAVYIHGVTREVLNLVRASKQVRDHAGPMDATSTTTQQVYAELLDALSPHVQLRVVVDIVAGASAGGINGIMLARALAFDLSLDSHRKMWLELADVTELLDPRGRAKFWSKPFMRPMLSLLGRWQAKPLAPLANDAARKLEVRQKISLFTRSRWFQPPFSGERMSGMMLDGLLSMGRSEASSSSLMPPGHPLDLFVTSTDFWGHKQLLKLHDPPVITESEHRHVLSFRHLQYADGVAQTAFSDHHVPSLAFAARATSCFPGAFPPAQLREMDVVTAQMGLKWPGRAAFIDRSFRAQLFEGQDIENAAFIDGSVLMNKPLDLAIRAVQHRSASREVDRRVVYIDPNPDRRSLRRAGKPGFFNVLKASLSDIPRNQPIRDDIEWLNAHNARSENIKQIITALTPRVLQSVTKIRGGLWGRELKLEKLAQWREKANSTAAENAGFTYGAYARLKVLTVLEDIAATLNTASTVSQETLINTELDQWAYRHAILPMNDAGGEAQHDQSAPWVQCLKNYDVRFRIRRIRFILRRINELYRTLEGAQERNRAWLNEAKSVLYASIQRIEQAGALTGLKDAHVFGDVAAAPPPEHIDALMVQVSQGLNLDALDDAFDQSFVDVYNAAPDRKMADSLLDCYLSFSFFDVATLPLTQWRDLYELDEVRVDRISANDANSLDRGGARQILKGAELGSFGAFFSRTYRENDYLWGRLTGAERLIDIVLSAAPKQALDGQVRKFKQRIFEAILNEEQPYLERIPDVFEDIEKRVRAMT
ncbi:MAG: patatin-like protein [Pseudomonadota bacterium]